MVRPCFRFSPKFSSEEMKEEKGERKGKKAAAREEITRTAQLSLNSVSKSLGSPSFSELCHSLTITTAFILACMTGFLSVTSSKRPQMPLSSCNLISCVIRMTAPKSPREGSGAAGYVCLSLSGSHDNWFWQNKRPLRS